MRQPSLRFLLLRWLLPAMLAGPALLAAYVWRLRRGRRPAVRFSGVELVREARAIFGPARAAALWRTLQLPEAPTIAAIAGGDAMDCLNYLLISMADDGRPIGMLLDRAMEDDADAAALLRLHGIRVVSDMVEVEGFIVSNTAPGLVRLFDGSPWRELGHMKALRRLVGAVSTGPMKYDGPRAARGTFIPATYLDSEARR